MAADLSLQELCERGAIELIEKRLQDGERGVNDMDGGMTPLMMAIFHQNLKLMKVLVQHGAKLDFVQVNAPPPCYYAIMLNDSLSLFWLLKAGAKVHYPFVPAFLRPHHSLEAFANHCHFFEDIQDEYDLTNLSLREKVGILATKQYATAMASTFDTEFEVKLDPSKSQQCTHVAATFFVRGTRFEIKVLPATHRCLTHTEEDVLEPYHLFHTPTSVFVGIADDERLPEGGKVLINYRVDLYLSKSKSWLIGKEISGTLTDMTLDRGLRKFAEGNGWRPSHNSFYASTIRVSFKLVNKNF